MGHLVYVNQLSHTRKLYCVNWPKTNGAFVSWDLPLYHECYVNDGCLACGFLSWAMWKCTPECSESMNSLNIIMCVRSNSVPWHCMCSFFKSVLDTIMANTHSPFKSFYFISSKIIIKLLLTTVSLTNVQWLQFSIQCDLFVKYRTLYFTSTVSKSLLKLLHVQ